MEEVSVMRVFYAVPSSIIVQFLKMHVLDFVFFK